jgi:hypothetical protein
VSDKSPLPRGWQHPESITLVCMSSSGDSPNSMQEASPGENVAVRTRWVIPLVLLGVSLGMSLAAMELGLRIWKGNLTGVPDPNPGISMIGHVYPGSYDLDLGYAPTPGAAALNPIWRTSAHISADGVRSNGRSQVEPTGPPIVAVGDSFTYGDEVNDRDTWPAALERLTGRPVVNGGVFGYGFDQIVLRSESLMHETEADTLIVSLIADDIRRCEYSYRYSWKPYFDVVDGKLIRGHDPVPLPDVEPPGENSLHGALRWSFLADFVLRRVDPHDWIVRGSVRIHRRGEEVARALVNRLADAAAVGGHRLLLVVQWLPKAESYHIGAVIEQARARRVEVLVVEPVLRVAIKNSPLGVKEFFNVRSVPGISAQVGHMSPAGNQFIAEFIAEAVKQ